MNYEQEWRDADVTARPFLAYNPTQVLFWRCKHHPSAIDNWAAAQDFGEERIGCEHGCDLQPLRWHDNGFSVARAA